MYSAIAANKRNTIFIMLVFLVIIGGLGWFAAYMYGDINIAIFTVVIAAAYAFFQYYLASSQALSMAGAIEIQKADNPRLFRIVENLCIATGTHRLVDDLIFTTLTSVLHGVVLSIPAIE